MARQETAALRRGWTTGLRRGGGARRYSAAVDRPFSRSRHDPPAARRRPRNFPLALAEQGAAGLAPASSRTPATIPTSRIGALDRRRACLGGAGFRRRISRRRRRRHGDATPGLALAVGEPAINPAPRAMIREALRRCRRGERRARRSARRHGDDRDPRRRAPRREDDERQARDRRRAVGARHDRDRRALFLRARGSMRSTAASTSPAPPVSSHIAAATGTTSERAVQRLYGLPEHALIDMGDFVGGTLKYLRRHPVRAPDPGRRLRQARQARRRPSRPAFEPQPGRCARHSPACSAELGADPAAVAAAAAASDSAAEILETRRRAGGRRSPRRWRGRRAKWRWRR